MTTTHLRHLEIVTLDAVGTIHHDADIVVSDGRIAHIGQAPEDLRADEVVDGSGRVAMPGLVNSHCHSPMTFERGWAEDLPFDRWLNEKIWVAESALTSDDVYWGAALAACEMIRSGTVAYNDKYFYMDRVADVVRASGMKAALTWTVFGIGEDAEVASTAKPLHADMVGGAGWWVGRAMDGGGVRGCRRVRCMVGVAGSMECIGVFSLAHYYFAPW